MSTHALSWAWRQEVGDAGAKLVLLKLADQANDAGECWPSQRTLAAECEMSRRTVQRKLEILYAAGLVSATPRVRADGADSSLLFRVGLHEVSGEHVSAPVRQIDAPPCVTGDAPPTSAVTHHEPSLEPTSPAEAGDGRRSAPLELVWDFLEAKFGAVAVGTNAHGRRKKAAADLRKLGATDESLRHAVVRWPFVFPGATLTDIALATHYPQLTSDRRPSSETPSGETPPSNRRDTNPLDSTTAKQALEVATRLVGLGGDRVDVSRALLPSLGTRERRAVLDEVDTLRGETPRSAYRRWVVEHADDPDLEHIVATWTDLDDIERAELVELAAAAHTVTRRDEEAEAA